MAKMGYVAGGGLGKHGEGRAEAILDRGNVGALGLGYAVKGLTDTASTMPEPLSAEEEIEMPTPDWIELSAPALPVPEAEELAGWAEEGNRVESIDDETGFVDGEVLREMLSAKNVLDEIQDRRAFDDARNRANPFEGVRKEFFINRAAAKMAAMDAACGWIFSYADAEEPAREGGASSNPPDAPFGTAPRPAPSLLHFGDVAAGPGGFSEYLLWRRGGSACGVGFTLRGDHDFTLQRFHYKAVPELFHPYYGPKDDGDLYQSTNLRALQALVGRQTAGAGLHVVMADGGFDVSGAENIQEVLNKQLLLTQFAAALGCLAEGGHFVCKAFDLFTPFSAGLLYVMYRCFDAVCVYKPAASRPANSERYIICKGLRRANPPAFEYLLTVNDRLNVLKRAWRSSGQKEGDGGQDVTALAPGALLGLGTPFGSYLTESNNRLGRLQAKALRRLVAMLRNPGERCGDQTATREACLTAWRLPADAPPVIEHPDIETFYLREVGADDMPRAVEAQPLRGRDFDPESVTAKLRRAEDWVCLESSAEKPVLMLGADGEGRRGLVFTWDAIHSTWQLRQEAVLPRGTLLLVEMVAEQTAQGGFQACCPLPAAHCPLPTAHCLLPTTHCTLLAACCLLPAACCLLPAACCLLPAACCPLLTMGSSYQECAHVIDAACLAGQDVRRLAFAERRRRVALLLQGLQADPACLAQQGRGGVRRLPVRIKPVWPWLATPTLFLTLALTLTPTLTLTTLTLTVTTLTLTLTTLTRSASSRCGRCASCQRRWRRARRGARRGGRSGGRGASSSSRGITSCSRAGQRRLSGSCSGATPTKLSTGSTVPTASHAGSRRWRPRW